MIEGFVLSIALVSFSIFSAMAIINFAVKGGKF